MRCNKINESEVCAPYLETRNTRALLCRRRLSIASESKEREDYAQKREFQHRVTGDKHEEKDACITVYERRETSDCRSRARYVFYQVLDG